MKNGKMRGNRFKQISIGLFLAAFCMPAFGRPKISPDLEKSLQSGASTQMLRVIVRWRSAPTGSFHQKVTGRGGQLISTLDSIRSSAYTVPSAALPDLANDSDVEYIAPDRPVSAKLDYTVAAVNGSMAWNSGWTGAGIGVALIDSGVNPDSNLAGHLVFSYDFLGGNGRDLFGHGEHVAGILAGNGQSTSCPSCFRMLKGLAPGVNLVNLRVLDQNGQGSDSTVIAAIELAIALKPIYNIRVMNLSLGRPVYESYTLDPLCQAVEAAWKAGIVVVVAAGNDGRDNSFGTDGYGTIMSPGNDPYVITVGAMKTEATYDRTDDRIASYSSKGPSQIDHIVKPDIVAPGNQVVSLLATNSTLVNEYPGNRVLLSYYQQVNSQQQQTVSPNFFTLSGTSMATPVVSAAVADLLQAEPFLTPDQVKARLMKTAYKSFPASSTVVDPTTGQSYTSYYDIFTVGAGYLDLAAAIADQTLATGPALSPVANYDPTSGTIAVTLANGSAWANNDSYAARCIWSENAIWGSTAATSNFGTVLTYSSIASDRCIWATNAIWSDRCIWSEDTLSGQRCIWPTDVAITGEP
jgi:serine protease AprX